MFSSLQQATELIQKNKNILIALPQNLNGDSLGSALTLDSILKKLGKKSEIVSQENVPEKFNFLSGVENIKQKISSLRDFIISVDTSRQKISRLRYETEENILKIIDNPNLAKQISKNNIEKSKEFDWDTITRRYIDEYEKLLIHNPYKTPS